MKRITLGSMFRDSAGYLPRYLNQLAQLRELFDVRCVWAFGDCTDNTGTILYKESHQGDTVIQVDHGGRNYGSIDVEERWLMIANVFAELIRYVPDDVPFVWVESDLIWSPDVIWGLVNTVERFPFDVVCPRVLAEGSDRWYDVWGFRRDGRMFDPFPPYVPDYAGDNVIRPRRLMVDSCGSCFVAEPEAIRAVREWGGHWPLSVPNLWLDLDLTVRHPELRG